MQAANCCLYWQGEMSTGASCCIIAVAGSQPRCGPGAAARPDQQGAGQAAGGAAVPGEGRGVGGVNHKQLVSIIHSASAPPARCNIPTHIHTFQETPPALRGPAYASVNIPHYPTLFPGTPPALRSPADASVMVTPITLILLPGTPPALRGLADARRRPDGGRGLGQGAAGGGADRPHSHQHAVPHAGKHVSDEGICAGPSIRVLVYPPPLFLSKYPPPPSLPRHRTATASSPRRSPH